MNQEGTTQGIENEKAHAAFRGFLPPTSSTTYTPNQFFDTVLPHSSRGCLRLVAYLIRKTLGWSDAQGNPLNPSAHVTYKELVECAGISRGAIKDAIDEALEKRFIDCLRFGQSHKAGEEGYSALYSLRWNESEEYITSLSEFQGFYAGNGNLTHIPNQFFDHLVPSEPLGVIRVVGVIIRHTIGFQSKFGLRRKHVEMSFSEIMRRTGIASSSTVNTALQTAISSNYICKVSEGYFDPEAGTTSKATTFGLRWNDVQFEPELANGSKIEAGNRFKNRSGDLETVQKSKRANGTEIEVDNGSKSEAETVQESKRERFKNRSDIKTTSLNNIPKQQQQRGDVAAGNANSLSLLLGEGFDREAARFLSERHPFEEIQKQVGWIAQRKSSSNRLGMLRRAIEGKWPAPEAEIQTAEHLAAENLVREFYQVMTQSGQGSIVPPSAEELDLGKSLMMRLSQLGAKEIGSQFAQYVKRQPAKKGFVIETFKLALKMHGDKFIHSTLQSSKQIVETDSVRIQQSHQDQFQSDYEKFVSVRVSEMLSESKWQAHFEVQAADRLERRKRMSAKAYEMLRTQLSTEEGRHQFFRDWLQENYPDLIPSFWAWDATINEHPLDEKKVGARFREEML